MKSLLISLQMLSFIFIIIQRCLIKKKKEKWPNKLKYKMFYMYLRSLFCQIVQCLWTMNEMVHSKWIFIKYLLMPSDPLKPPTVSLYFSDLLPTLNVEYCTYPLSPLNFFKSILNFILSAFVKSWMASLPGKGVQNSIIKVN